MNDPGEAGKISRDVNSRVRHKVFENDTTIDKGNNRREWDDSVIKERKLERKQLIENEKDERIRVDEEKWSI